MSPSKKIPVVLVPAYDLAADVNMSTPIVRVPELSLDAQAEYQSFGEPIEEPIDEDDDSFDEESEDEVEPEPVSSLRIQIKPLDATKRLEYNANVDPDAQKKRFRAEKEDPEFNSRARPVQTIIRTCAGAERIAR